jgi:hypothetical protein
VIVAEQITSRFFNVLRLLNRSVPMIAIQLSAFQLDDASIVLHPVTVLDVFEEITEVDDPGEQADRAFWEKKVEPSSLAIMDKIVSHLKSSNVDPRLTYNKYHIAMGTTGNQFCWFHPRKSFGNCHMEIRVTNETRDQLLSTLQSKGIDASPRRTDRITLSLTTKGLSEHTDAIIDTLKRAEEYSRM